MTRFTPAEDTATRLHDAMRDGVPLLIPGALEKLVSRPPERQPIDPVVVAAASRAASRAATDRGRLEHEREGGGAPGQRSGRRHGILVRLAHCALHPADLPMLWRHALQ